MDFDYSPRTRELQAKVQRFMDNYVINGRKWWISGAANPRAVEMPITRGS